MAAECTEVVPQSIGQQSDSSFCLPLLDGNPGTATVYRFSNVDHELAHYLPWGGNGLFYVGSKLELVPNLEVAVLDKDKRELQVELISGLSWQGPDKNGRTALEMMKPWLLYSPPRDNQFGAILMRQRTFSVVMKIDDAALRQADSIRVMLVK